MPSMTPEIRVLYNAARKRLLDAGLDAKPMYHQTRDLKGLMSEGPRLPNAGTNESWKPRGLYAAESLPEQQMLTTGDFGTLSTFKNMMRRGNPDPIVRVLPKPNARVKTITEEQLIDDWTNDIAPPGTDLSIPARNARDAEKWKDTDIVRNLHVDGQEGVAEAIITNPKAVSIFSHDKAWNPAIAAAILGGTAGALTSSDAEALPLGSLRKLDPKTAAKFTRTLDPYYALQGKTLNLTMGDAPRSPHTIVDVLRKGTKGDERLLVVKNTEGEFHQLPMTKDYLNVLLGATGTQTYTDAFLGKKYLEAKNQAVRSLVRRQNTRENGALGSQREFEQWNNMQAAKAHEIDPALVNDYVYFKPEQFDQQVYVPKPYAEMLQKKGYGEITTPGPNPKNVLAKERAPKTKRAYTPRVSTEDMMATYRANQAAAKAPPEPTITAQQALRETTPEEQEAVREHLRKHYLEVGSPDSIATYMQDYTKILREIVNRRQ